nr:VP1/VP2 [Porcine bocavirus]
MSLKRGQFRGLLFPGYNYLGPFNPLENGDPVNKADEAAKKHDQAYNNYINKGLNPYLKFNKGDQDFIDSLQSDSSVGGNFARAVFHLKKQIAPALNEPKDTGEPPAKKDKRAGNKRHLYFARLNKGAKKAKADPNNMDGDLGDNEQGAGEAPVEGGGERSAGGGGAIGGGGGGGNHGVGISTGGWIGGSILGKNKIITRNTRQWWCPIRNEHKYKQYNQFSQGGTTFNMMGYSTPWSMFNFNQYSSHFNPNEWQWLLNRAKRFRPVRMEVKIYNIQIKQESTQDQNAQYTNDLTAGLHVLCDGEHAFPWTQLPWDKGCMPELPHEVWQLTQYAYLTVASAAQDSDATNQNEKAIRCMVPMYLLEETDHAVIRTGESVVFHHAFECGWVDNTHSSNMAQLACINPLVDSRLVKKFYTTKYNNGHTGTRHKPYQKSGAWWPGPGWRTNQTTNAQGNASVLGPFVTAFQPEGMTYGTGVVGYGAATGPYVGGQSGFASTATANSNLNGNYLRFTPGDADITNVTNSNIERKSVLTGTRDQTLYQCNGTNSTEQVNVFMMPNQMWDSAQISRYNPIWVKTPRVDRHTLIDTEDGTLPMAHPPGTIYVKLAHIPTPGNNGADYLNIYATGQVSCEIEWEFEEHFNKNWRPERRIDAAHMDPNVYKISDSGTYQLPQSYYDAMPTRLGLEKVL